MVRTRRADGVDDVEQPIGAGAHVLRLNAPPQRVDADQRTVSSDGTQGFGQGAQLRDVQRLHWQHTGASSAGRRAEVNTDVERESRGGDHGPKTRQLDRDELQGMCSATGRRRCRVTHRLEAATREPLAHDIGVQAVRDSHGRD